MSKRNAIRTVIRIAIFLASLIASPLFAQDLPSKPEPRQTQSQARPMLTCACKYRVVDREFIADVTVVGTSWVFDTISTHEFFDHHPGGYEIGYLFPGSRSTPKIMGAWLGVDIAAVVVSYELKKHVHNRYLHPFLWRAPLFYRAEGHFAAAVHNIKID